MKKWKLKAKIDELEKSNRAFDAANKTMYVELRAANQKLCDLKVVDCVVQNVDNDVINALRERVKNLEVQLDHASEVQCHNLGLLSDAQTKIEELEKQLANGGMERKTLDKWNESNKESNAALEAAGAKIADLERQLVNNRAADAKDIEVLSEQNAKLAQLVDAQGDLVAEIAKLKDQLDEANTQIENYKLSFASDAGMRDATKRIAELEGLLARNGVHDPKKEAAAPFVQARTGQL